MVQPHIEIFLTTSGKTTYNPSKKFPWGCLSKKEQNNLCIRLPTAVLRSVNKWFLLGFAKGRMEGRRKGERTWFLLPLPAPPFSYTGIILFPAFCFGHLQFQRLRSFLPEVPTPIAECSHLSNTWGYQRASLLALIREPAMECLRGGQSTASWVPFSTFQVLWMLPLPIFSSSPGDVSFLWSLIKGDLNKWRWVSSCNGHKQNTCAWDIIPNWVPRLGM